jgi:hypothetical protein
MRTAALLSLVALLFGCAAAIEAGADRVQLVTPGQKERQCKSLGIFTVEHRVGPNKPGSAMNKALNETFRRGGNGIYVVSTSVDWAEGASVTAEALQCQF